MNNLFANLGGTPMSGGPTPAIRCTKTVKVETWCRDGIPWPTRPCRDSLTTTKPGTTRRTKSWGRTARLNYPSYTDWPRTSPCRIGGSPPCQRNRTRTGLSQSAAPRVARWITPTARPTRHARCSTCRTTPTPRDRSRGVCTTSTTAFSTWTPPNPVRATPLTFFLASLRPSVPIAEPSGPWTTSSRRSPLWEETLLIISFDEHGGTYDHVAPPKTVRPDDSPSIQPFSFDRLGVRVPTILVSPHVRPGSIFRAPTNSEYDFDHTSIIATLARWVGRDPATVDLGLRVASAPTFEDLIVDEIFDAPTSFPVPNYYKDLGGEKGPHNIPFGDKLSLAHLKHLLDLSTDAEHFLQLVRDAL